MAFPTANLYCRYEAESESGYTDGDTLTSIVDQSGAGRNLTVAGNPTWQDAEINGLATYRFDGTDDKATRAVTLSGKTAWTIGIVVSSGVAESGAFRQWMFGTTYFGSTHIMALLEGNSAGEWGAWFRTSAGTQAPSTSGVDTTAWCVLTLEWDGSNCRWYRNGTQVGSDAALSGNFSADLITMGEIVSQFFVGDIALGAMWDSALGASARADFHGYVQDTFGISVSDYPSAGGGNPWYYYAQQ